MSPSGVWIKNSDGWQRAASESFTDEAELHDLIEQTPEMLPLSRMPDLAVLGREVPLGAGYADLLAVEASGHLVIIEVKLSKNNEARRAVVAQILAYAASLHGTTREQLENNLGSGLRVSENDSILDVVSSQFEDGFDADEFVAAFDNHLQEGRFRLVFVLDEAPSELMSLVAYLEQVTDKLTIDLVTINAFNVASSTAVIPHRVAPDRHDIAVRNQRNESGILFPGRDRFEVSLKQAHPSAHPHLRKLATWAQSLENAGLINLATYVYKDGKRATLLPRLKNERAGLVTIYNDGGEWPLSFRRTVFERRAPNSISTIETLTNITLGRGNRVQEVTDELLDALTSAYQEAAHQHS